MSLSKIFLMLTIMLTAGCESFVFKNDSADDFLVVKMNAAFSELALQKLEKIMILEMPSGFTDVTVFSGDNNKKSAFQLKDYFTKTYGMTSQVYLLPEKDELYIQFKKHHQNDCYYYELNDFNWYKSTPRDIEKFSHAEICATNSNDHALKA